MVMNGLLDYLRNIVRIWARAVAQLLNRIGGGRITPNQITVIALLMHVPIALLIATGHFAWAAVLLTVFGLFDTLDGELARLQKKDSAAGMVLDASTDRMKEVALYSGVAYNLAHTGSLNGATWAVLACGFSLCVSYVKAKGETAVAKSDLTVSQVNRLFQDGLLRFEVRMGLLILGLVFAQLTAVIMAIAVLSAYTALDRLIRITRSLDADARTGRHEGHDA